MRISDWSSDVCSSELRNLAGSNKSEKNGKNGKSGKKQRDGDGPIIIKKYANRRLYNTATSSYVTLDHLCQMVQEDVDFVVYDAKSGDDITRAVLTQIIVEEIGRASCRARVCQYV